jgi:replicative DNA helicase
MFEIPRANSSLDYLVLMRALEVKRCLDAIGGVDYLMGLGSDLPRRFNPSAHVDIEAWRRREVQRICQAVLSRAGEGADTAVELLGELQSQVLDVLAVEEALGVGDSPSH